MPKVDVMPESKASPEFAARLATLVDAAKSGDDPRRQADKFRDLAHELECDEDEEAFKTKLTKVATASPQSKSKPPHE